MHYVSIVLAFTLTFILSVSAQSQNCISPAELRDAIERVRVATVRLHLPKDNLGTGFLVKTALGTELVTAHHNVHDDNNPGTCTGEADDVAPEKITKVNRIQFHSQQNAKPVNNYRFPTDSANMSFGNDSIKGPMSRSHSFKTIEVENSARPLTNGADVILMGIPANGDRFTTEHCKMKGFVEPMNGETDPAYSLRCPGITGDIGGMSGGAAISKCSGKVVGSLSAQAFHQGCPKQGDRAEITINPVSINPAGRVQFGLQVAVANSTCYHGSPQKNELYTATACNVGPGIFPPALNAGVAGRPQPSPISPTGSSFFTGSSSPASR